VILSSYTKLSFEGLFIYTAAFLPLVFVIAGAFYWRIAFHSSYRVAVLMLFSAHMLNALPWSYTQISLIVRQPLLSPEERYIVLAMQDFLNDQIQACRLRRKLCSAQEIREELKPEILGFVVKVESWKERWAIVIDPKSYDDSRRLSFLIRDGVIYVAERRPATIFDSVYPHILLRNPFQHSPVSVLGSEHHIIASIYP